MGFIGGVDQLHHEGHPFTQVGRDGERDKHREIPLAGEVFAEHMAATAIERFQAGLEVFLAPELRYRLAGLLTQELEIRRGGEAQDGDIRLHGPLD
ncbi:hypothetical protein D3C84_872260 [compost metagenome]